MIQGACAALLVRKVLCRTVHAEFKALPKFVEASAGFNARGAAGGNGPLKIGSCSTCTGTPADAAIGHSAGSLRLACGVPVTTNGFKTRRFTRECFERNDARGRDGALPYGLERASSHSDA